MVRNCIMASHCNSGTAHTNTIVNFPLLHQDVVWFCSSCISNIPALAQVIQNYPVTYDSQNEFFSSCACLKTSSSSSINPQGGCIIMTHPKEQAMACHKDLNMIKPYKQHLVSKIVQIWEIWLWLPHLKGRSICSPSAP